MLTLRLRHSRCIRTQCSGEILCAAADRLYVAKTVWIVGVGFVPGREQIAVGIIASNAAEFSDLGILSNSLAFYTLAKS